MAFHPLAPPAESDYVEGFFEILQAQARELQLTVSHMQADITTLRWQVNELETALLAVENNRKKDNKKHDDSISQEHHMQADITTLRLQVSKLETALLAVETDRKKDNRKHGDSNIQEHHMQADITTLRLQVSKLETALLAVENDCKEDDKKHDDSIIKEHYEEQGGDTDNHSKHDAAGQGQIMPVIEYEFVESVWDISLFLFDGQLGIGANLSLMLILVLNFLCQVVFMGILILYYSTPELNDDVVKQVGEWRVAVGHNEFWADPANFYSVAKKVCELDMSLGTGGDKVALLSNIKQYWAGNDITHAFFSGPALSTVCVLAWAAICLHEVRRAIHAIYIVAFAGRAVKQEERAFDVKSISNCRRAWMIGLFIIQIVLDVCLTVIGSIFIASTADVKQIMGNALALQFIFNIDEFLFQAFAPSVSRNLIKDLRPLRKAAHHLRGSDINSFFIMLAGIAVVVAVYLSVTLQTLQRVKDVQTELCGGNLGFIYKLDGVGLPWVYDPENFQLHSQKIGYSRTQVVETIKNGDADFLTQATGSRDFQVRVSNISSDDWQYFHTISSNGSQNLCQDLILDKNDMMKNKTRIAYFVSRFGPTKNGAGQFASCEEMSPNCWESPFIRSVCPHSCGCNDPVGGTLTSDLMSITGCPSSGCSIENTFYMDKVKIASCEDYTNVQDVWSNWSLEFADIISSEAAPVGKQWPCRSREDCRTHFNSSKCGIIAYWMEWALNNSVLAVNPCSGAWGNQVALTPFYTSCPRSCGCNENTTKTLAACPAACMNLTRSS